MSIYNKEKDLKTEKINQVINFNKNALLGFANSIMTSYELFWNNPSLTPQEICDIYGTDATQLFADHAGAIEFVESRYPDIATEMGQTVIGEETVNRWDLIKSIPEKYEVTFNEDGTVTIVEK